MLARGRPVSWARLSQPFLKQSEGFGLDAESPRDALWHFPHAKDIRAEGERGRVRERRICPYSIHSFSLCLYAICANDDGKCRCENFKASVKGEGENRTRE